MRPHFLSKSILFTLLALGAFGWLALPLVSFAYPTQSGFGQMTSSLNPSHYGQSVTFTVCFATKPTGPTVNNNFYDGNTILGQGMNSGNCTSFTTSSLSIGTHHIALGNPNDPIAALDQNVLGPLDVPEGGSLVLLGGGLGGLSLWLRWQWTKRRKN